MRTKVTRKQISDNYFCIGVGYCALQHLLTYAKSPYYTAGTYGWNFDAYTFEFLGSNVCITTGHRSTIDNCKHNGDCKIQRKYDKLAEEILSNDTKDKKEQLDVLIDEFLSFVFSPVIGSSK